MRRGPEGLPVRIAWALDLLNLAPADEVLEFGCGPGVAASAVADRLPDGCITAIDRSATAITRARRRGAHHLQSGRLLLQQAPLAELMSEKRFDKAFGVNVNVFWTTPADAECTVLREVLAPRGLVHLVYEGPGERERDVPAQVAATLRRHGFAPTVGRGPNRSLVSITGLRRP